MLSAVWFLLLLLPNIEAQGGGASGGHPIHTTLCYVDGWTHWRNEPVKFEVEDIDTHLCTHVAYNYAELDPSGTHIVPHDNFDYGIWQRLTNLKNGNPNLKVLLTLGGWGMGSDEFSTMTSDEDKLQTFIDGLLRQLRAYKFDGLVIDWEYPGTRGDPPEDKHRFTVLLQALQEAFVEEASQSNKPQLLLVATIKPDPWQISQSYELPDIANYVDILDVKAFQLHGTWETTSAHHSPLYSTTGDPADSIHHMVQQLIVNMSVPLEKMTLGIAFYGVAENMSDPTDTDLGSPISGGAEGPILHQQGMMAYFEICKLLQDNADSVTTGRLSDTSSPYLTYGTTWTGYDDPVSVQEKVDYVVKQRLMGVSVWTIDLDDFNGLCGSQNPLLSAISSQFHQPVVG